MEDDLEIIFKEEEMEYLDLNHDDALVIFMRMVNTLIKVMINIGSSTNMLYFHAFQKFGILTNDFTPMTFLLMRFTGNLISPLRIVNIYVTFGDKLYSKTIITKFIVVDILLAYNEIIGLFMLNRLRAMVSTHNMVMKFSVRTSMKS